MLKKDNSKSISELLTFFLIKITYPSVFLKMSYFYFSESQINYSLKTCRAEEVEGKQLEPTFQRPVRVQFGKSI
jgi:hypothetical protein